MKAKDCVETSAKTKMQSKYIINPMKALLLKINSEFCLTKTRNNIRDEMTKTRIKLVFIQKIDEIYGKGGQEWNLKDRPH